MEGGRLCSANISQLVGVYQVNIRAFFRAILHWVDYTRDPGLYEDEVDATDERLSSQLLFSYRLNPRTVL